MRSITTPSQLYVISIILLFFLACSILFPISATACTSFCLNENVGPVVGANYDGSIPDGMIVINKRGFRKTAMTDPEKKLNPASWKSKYGSITFNFLGIDWPWAGMNEAGLVITSMRLKETQYPQQDERPSIHMAQWVQYQLDRFSTVDEVVSKGHRLRIRNNNSQSGVHYMVVDQLGNCAVVEFMAGRFVFYSEDQLPIKVLANDPYARSLQNTKNFKGFGGSRQIPDGNMSYGRFLRAASKLQRPNSAHAYHPIDHAFNILNRVRFNNHPYINTQWSIVFDTRTRHIYIKTRQLKTIRSIDLGTIDYSCTGRVKTIDIQHPLSTDGIRMFLDYDYQINRTGFQRAFPKNPMKARLSESRLDRISRYPETFLCEER